MAIEGKIARIIDESHLVINVGSAQGVKNGMNFAVFAEVDEVKDPDTGESLGKWELVKVTVTADHVQERMTVCMPQAEPAPETKDPAERGTNVLSAEMIEVSRLRQPGQRQKLAVNMADASGMPRVRPISVGDRVRSLE